MKRIRKHKIIISLLIIVCFIFTVPTTENINAEAKAPKMIFNYIPNETSNKVLYVPFGDGVGNVSYTGGNESEILAPQSFFVTDNNTIYICDTVNYRVIEFKNNELISEIHFNQKFNIIDIFINEENEIFLLDDNYKVYQTSSSGIIDCIYEIPIINANETTTGSGVYFTPKTIRYEDNKLFVRFSNNNEYWLNDGCLEKIDSYGYTYSLNGNKPYFKKKGTKRIYPKIYGTALEISVLKKDKNNKTYVKISDFYQNEENMEYILEDSIRIYNGSKLENEVFILQKSNFFFPNKNVFITDNGKIYQMLIDQDGVYIYELPKDIPGKSKLKKYIMDTKN